MSASPFQRKTPWALKFHSRLLVFGIDFPKFLSALRGIPKVKSDRKVFLVKLGDSRDKDVFPVVTNRLIPGEDRGQAGAVRGHYLNQDLIVSREIYKRNPQRHVDVGSSIAGLVSNVASFRDIDVLDIRPLDRHIPGINFVQADLMTLRWDESERVDSVSCLHALEHFGLGRYGDSIDPEGWRAGFEGLKSMLITGGTLYFSVPTGETQRIEFNAHRIFSVPFLLEFLSRDFVVQSFSFITDNGTVYRDSDPRSRDALSSYGSRYGCSIWILGKK